MLKFGAKIQIHYFSTFWKFGAKIQIGKWRFSIQNKNDLRIFKHLKSWHQKIQNWKRLIFGAKIQIVEIYQFTVLSFLVVIENNECLVLISLWTMVVVETIFNCFYVYDWLILDKIIKDWLVVYAHLVLVPSVEISSDSGQDGDKFT